MNNWGSEKSDQSDNIAPKKWLKYFDELLNQRQDRSNPETIPSNVPTFNPSLDGTLSEIELRKALNKLKGGKSPGPDGILGDCLKVFGRKCESLLLLILKRVFDNHIYPDGWTTNYLKPIYKKGGTSDPDNFRGLAIGSALGKLFSIVMVERLETFIKSEKLISSNQIGFMKG